MKSLRWIFLAALLLTASVDICAGQRGGHDQQQTCHVRLGSHKQLRISTFDGGEITANEHCSYLLFDRQTADNCETIVSVDTMKDVTVEAKILTQQIIPLGSSHITIPLWNIFTFAKDEITVDSGRGDVDVLNMRVVKKNCKGKVCVERKENTFVLSKPGTNCPVLIVRHDKREIEVIRKNIGNKPNDEVDIGLCGDGDGDKENDLLSCDVVDADEHMGQINAFKCSKSDDDVFKRFKDECSSPPKRLMNSDVIPLKKEENKGKGNTKEKEFLPSEEKIVQRLQKWMVERNEELRQEKQLALMERMEEKRREKEEKEKQYKIAMAKHDCYCRQREMIKKKHMIQDMLMFIFLNLPRRCPSTRPHHGPPPHFGSAFLGSHPPASPGSSHFKPPEVPQSINLVYHHSKLSPSNLPLITPPLHHPPKSGKEES